MNGPSLPAFAMIASALRATTERLTLEVASPQTTAPEWNDFEWRVAQAVCALHGISGLLATRLVWHGPVFFGEFLREQRQQTLARHLAAGQTLAELARTAENAGLAYVALKGSAMREFAIHHAGDRPMGDIDILIRPRDRELAARVLESMDHMPIYTSRRHDVYRPRQAGAPHAFAEHTCSPLRVEVHQCIGEALPVDTLDITAQIWPDETRPGVNRYRSYPALVRHVMLHASGNMRANAMRFIQIYDVALLLQRFGPADWAELIGTDPATTAWWMYPVLTLADRYVPGSVPAPLLAQFAAWCPPRLRRRFEHRAVYDVSWSNLRIAALPGLEWARGIGERLRLARHRLLPGRQALTELQQGTQLNPSLADSAWYRSSQAARVMRWVVGKPARVQTMASLRAALSAGRHDQQ